MVRTVAGLCDRGRIDVDLNPGLALGKDIGLEVGGNFDDKEQFTPVHLCIDIGRSDLHGRLKGRTHKPLGDLPR